MFYNLFREHMLHFENFSDLALSFSKCPRNFLLNVISTQSETKMPNRCITITEYSASWASMCQKHESHMGTVMSAMAAGSRSRIFARETRDSRDGRERYSSRKRGMLRRSNTDCDAELEQINIRFPFRADESSGRTERRSSNR